MKAQEVLLGSLLLLLIMGMDVAAIKMLFGQGVTVLLVSVLLGLECLFMLSYHCHERCKPGVSLPPTRWSRRFQAFFLVLTLCCIGVFATHDLGLLDVYRPTIQLAFWWLFAGLAMLGVGLALYTLLDEPETAATKAVDPASDVSTQYGKAGYS